MLDNAESVLSAAYGSGLSGPGRLHDHFVAVEAATPGEYRSGGAGLRIGFGTGDSPFGPVFVAWTDRGVCRLSFAGARDVETEKRGLGRTWGRAVLEADDSRAGSIAETIFSAPFDPDAGPLTVHVRGTNFQLAVWRALLRIPTGAVTTYGRLAEEVCSARAARAAGNAVGSNPISFLIPCHRVIRAT
ncbi:MAG: methylated-DNA--[protein]-cysteine S-methyltransferase, partial [Gammaproteobacteria bacterium]|nr:methylated-DNA--[protein]-cysteine S-methyltransferase [Gammaproteobacteria bacterium]